MWDSDAAYDNFMGRFSSKLAPAFADFAAVKAGERVLDVGAGTGMLTQELVRRRAVTAAIEPAPAFAETLRRRFPDVDVREGPGEQLPWADGSFDVALAQLVVAFMDDATKGVAEMARVANGRFAVCMWDLEGHELLASVMHVRHRMGEADTEPLHERNVEQTFTHRCASLQTAVWQGDFKRPGHSDRRETGVRFHLES